MSAKLQLRMKTMLLLYGTGPEGKRCKGCAHLVVKQYAGRYYKCNLNTDTGGPASDWRCGWPACGKYVVR